MRNAPFLKIGHPEVRGRNAHTSPRPARAAPDAACVERHRARGPAAGDGAYRAQRHRTAADARLPHRRHPRFGRRLPARARHEDAAAAARRSRRHRHHGEPPHDADRRRRRHARERAARPRQDRAGHAAGIATPRRRPSRCGRPGRRRRPAAVDRSRRPRPDLSCLPRPRDPPLRLPHPPERHEHPAHRRAPPPRQLGAALVPVRLRHGAPALEHVPRRPHHAEPAGRPAVHAPPPTRRRRRHLRLPRSVSGGMEPLTPPSPSSPRHPTSSSGSRRPPA